MKAGTKRALAECLETDDSYSEMVDNDRWTGNGARIGHASARLDMLETRIESIWATLRDHERRIEVTSRKIEITSRKIEITSRKVETTSRKIETTSREIEMTNRVRVGQRNITLSAACPPHIRNRFISIFRRDILGDATSKDREIIGQGNLVADKGNLWADAKLYDREGFVAEDGKQFSPRDDYHVFKQLYGVAPSFAVIIDYTPTILVLEKHATIVSSAHLQTTDNFKERFNVFISSLKDSNYASGYLYSDSPQLKGLLFAYRAFWDAVRTEVSRRKTTDL
ncbi:hypothetical protein BDV39DRAFT_204434 [Aspergillus sergii]|uniref:Uncharacterized protein n=1 Tax=Aspergillus sergii TaxID=1034303 RepID=A0A5N6X518_9EURO|nr:hypothetical protein BDV39DRAFT_204434 [Aspergillus sergii]